MLLFITKTFCNPLTDVAVHNLSPPLPPQIYPELVQELKFVMPSLHLTHNMIAMVIGSLAWFPSRQLLQLGQYWAMAGVNDL